MDNVPGFSTESALGDLGRRSRQTRAYMIRVKLPAGRNMIPHKHPEDCNYTVVGSHLVGDQQEARVRRRTETRSRWPTPVRLASGDRSAFEMRAPIWSRAISAWSCRIRRLPSSWVRPRSASDFSPGRSAWPTVIECKLAASSARSGFTVQFVESPSGRNSPNDIHSFLINPNFFPVSGWQNERLPRGAPHGTLAQTWSIFTAQSLFRLNAVNRPSGRVNAD